MSPWEMLSDEEDLAIILRLITVMQNGTLRIQWLNGKESSYCLPKYSHKRGDLDDDKQ